MRTREKNISAPLCTTNWKYWNASGALFLQDTQSLTYRSASYTMTDEEKNPLGFNPCDHWKVENDKPGLITFPKAWHKTHNAFVQITPYPSQGPKGLWPYTVPDLDWSVALDELERNARGDMSTSVNMVVNVAELVELKSLAKSACSGFRALTRKWRISDPRVRRFLKNRKRKGRSASGPSLQEIADSHLAYSFGVRPLIKDIAGFLEINQKIRDRRKELQERSLIPTRISARITATSQDVTTEQIPTAGYDASLIQRKYDCWVKASGVVSAVSTAFYNLDNPSTRWKMVSQALGLTSPLTSIWNLIPFSFVADWFLPIGAAIKKVERAGWDLVDEAAVTKAFTLVDYHYSTKHECVNLLEATIVESVVPEWVGLRYCNQAQRWTHYVRTAGTPPVAQWWPDQSSDWSVSRTALSTSLSIQRLNKTPKPQPKKWPTLSQIFTKATHIRRGSR